MEASEAEKMIEQLKGEVENYQLALAEKEEELSHLVKGFSFIASVTHRKPN